MSPLTEKNYHRWFEWGVVLKLIVSVLEVLTGIALYFVSYDTIKNLAQPLLGDELNEASKDLFWNLIVKSSKSFVATPEPFWAFLFLSHGLVKLFLSSALLRNRLWAYPLSALIFGGFIIYQLHQISYTPSVFLWAITVFDVVLIVLILHEYRHKKRSIE